MTTMTTASKLDEDNELTMMPSCGFCMYRQWCRYSKSSYWRMTVNSVSSESFLVLIVYRTTSPFFTGSLTITEYAGWNGTYVFSSTGVDEADDEELDMLYLSASSDVPNSPEIQH